MITWTLAQGLPVDETLSTYSDLAFRTAFGIYALALVASLIYYAGFRVPKVSHQQLVGAGQGAAAGGSGTVGGPDVGLTESRSLTDTGDENRASEGNVRWARIAQLFIVVAFLFHAGSMITRGLATDRFPFGNMYEFILGTTLLAVGAGLVFLRKPALQTAWPFVLLPVLVLLFFGGTNLYSEAAPVVPALRSYWLPIHVTIISLGSGILLIPGVVSIMYLIRVWQPQGEERGWGARLARPLPAAETLDRLAYRATVIGFPVFGVGILLGAVWAESAWGRFWGWDPKETVSFISWVLYAGYLHARATSGWGPKKAAWINIAGFAVLVFNLFFINIVVSGLHSYAGLN
ncbi:c-type cytochrome biogenesis protein CcsB [Dietzia cinnamea]|uniref:c-type cytochrome biogenesis protein CcsB n=1 Tax=Dietzia cinnamea TaxID=321318 RepID=UPI0021A556DC|nr:c-type cytochrome biogenesis protein CcsB [Dietzia cinnamea]MCT2273874.1 c-type cytochrome biogenesis protein CcsB [Dietzia cinnamea]